MFKSETDLSVDFIGFVLGEFWLTRERNDNQVLVKCSYICTARNNLNLVILLKHILFLLGCKIHSDKID